MQPGGQSGAGRAAKAAQAHRLFFALMPDDATREHLHEAAQQLKATQPTRGRWVNPRRYHLTLQFLGEFDGLPTAVVAQARAAAARVRAAPFTLSLDHAGSFRNRAIPWWLGPGVDSPGLGALWHGLGEALAGAGVHVADGKGFRPHVTIVRDARTVLPATVVTPSIEWRVEAFSLMHSAPEVQGAYTSLGTWPLAR
ncbi:RNA 2',3'-cyclic phosphodiesterase [Lysobacter olei]